MGLVVFKAVEILISLPTNFTAIGLLLFHSECSRVRGRRLRIDNGEGPISVIVQLLIVVAMLHWVLEQKR